MVGQPVTTATILLEDPEYSHDENDVPVAIPTDLSDSEKEKIVSLLKSANLAFPVTAEDDDDYGYERTDWNEGMFLSLAVLLKAAACSRFYQLDLLYSQALHGLCCYTLSILLNCIN